MNFIRIFTKIRGFKKNPGYSFLFIFFISSKMCRIFAVYCPEEVSQWTIPQWESQLFDTVKEFEEGADSWSFDKFWTLRGTVPVYLAVALFPLMNFKSPTFFTKFNVLGTSQFLFFYFFIWIFKIKKNLFKIGKKI